MNELGRRCEVCRALLDEEDLFCPNCGREAPGEHQQPDQESETAAHTFQCQGCGASMSYDAQVQTLRCPFCESTQFEEKQNAKTLKARRTLPFAVERTQAERILRQWLGKGFWRPGDLAGSAVLTKLSPVLVPYWVFQAQTFTYWTADSNRTPAGARGDWVPMAGDHRGQYSGLLIGASSVLTPQETSALCPFPMDGAVENHQPSAGTVVEQFRVQRKYARPLAQQLVEQLEQNACAQYVPGSSRNVHVNVKLEGLSSEPVLLPVWVAAYRYKETLYRFLINGQTGRATGQAPFSWRKLVVIVAAVLGVFLVILLLAALLGGGGFG